MIADTRSELQAMAIQKLCPKKLNSVDGYTRFGMCEGNHCQMWQQKPIRGNQANGREVPPIVAYKGWCGLAGSPADDIGG